MRTQRIGRIVLAGAALGLLALAVSAGPAMAQQRPYGEGVLTKFARGLVNSATGWMELFKQPYVGGQKEGAEGAILGIGKGIGWTVGRTLSGVYDVVTFPIPLPENFEPLMKPDYVFEAD
jgi:putative exosortase-associated protein (TIGR04073 family)